MNARSLAQGLMNRAVEISGTRPASSTPSVALLRLPHAEGLPLPEYKTAEAVGVDLCAAVPPDAPLSIPPGGRALVPTGFAMALPPGFEAQIRPRSGLAIKHGITCLNSPGTIDSDYRGEVQIILINHGDAPFAIARGDRIAQMVIAPVVQARFTETDSLDETARGAGGFGSTGV